MILHDLVNAYLTVVVPTAANQVRQAEDLQADGALALKQGRRRVDEFTRIAALVLGLSF